MTYDPFVIHRSLLFTVAYEMLGSAADAEDVVQETWLRWAGVDQAEVDFPRAYLVRIVTRQALNRLRSVSRRREEYIGEWLPEPLLTSPDVAEDVELAENAPGFVATVAWLNGMPGARLDFDGAAAAMSLVVEGGRITHIYAINNPHKLGRLETAAELRR